MFKDAIGQQIRVNQRFVKIEYHYQKGGNIARTGSIKTVTNDVFVIVFDTGTASKRGRKMRDASDIIVNYDAIQEVHPEAFL